MDSDIPDEKDRLLEVQTGSLLDEILLDKTVEAPQENVSHFVHNFLLDYNAVLNHITLVLLPASITYVGKKAIDVFMKLVESAALKRLESREEPDRKIIELYDGSGAIVARVEVPSLPPKD